MECGLDNNNTTNSTIDDEFARHTNATDTRTKFVSKLVKQTSTYHTPV